MLASAWLCGHRSAPNDRAALPPRSETALAKRRSRSQNGPLCHRRSHLVLVDMVWTDFDAYNHATIMLSATTRHGRPSHSAGLADGEQVTASAISLREQGLRQGLKERPVRIQPCPQLGGPECRTHAAPRRPCTAAPVDDPYRSRALDYGCRGPSMINGGGIVRHPGCTIRRPGALAPGRSVVDHARERRPTAADDSAVL
jgi:hypothetical protein